MRWQARKEKLNGECAEGGRRGQLAATGAVCESDRHYDRILRFLYTRLLRCWCFRGCSSAGDPASATLQSLATENAPPGKRAISAVIADRHGRKPMLIAAFGLILAPLFGSGRTLGGPAFLSLGLALMDLTYGPLGLAYVGYYLSAAEGVTLMALLSISMHPAGDF